MKITKLECDSLIKSAIEGLQRDAISFKIGDYPVEDVDKIFSRLERLRELVKAFHAMKE
jgi:hypothetical protein